jgi:hypothetical protein
MLWDENYRKDNMLLQMKIHFIAHIQDELIVFHRLQTIYRVILLWRNSTCWVSHAGVQGIHCRHGESDAVDRVWRRFEVGHAGCGTWAARVAERRESKFAIGVAPTSQVHGES